MSTGKSRVEALIDELSEIHPKGFDLSLDRISVLLAKLGNPQLEIPPAFHVAGTNGKGSTIAFIRSILEEAGYRVHVHTSPHLVNWSERYRLAGRLVDDDTLADAIERAVAANGGNAITIFEIMSAVMFILFSEHEADFCLVEVGLGGRFDATNVITKPLVSVIAPVALDHQAYLGDTLTEIAFEKAGIIKTDTPVVIGIQEDDAREVMENVAEERNAEVKICGQDFDFYRDATGFVFQDENGLLDLPIPRLPGDHQLANAALAIAAVRTSGLEIADEVHATAMKNVVWPGRFEKLPKGKISSHMNGFDNIWVDGGHNPSAGEVVAAELKRRAEKHMGKILLVCGMINTKDPQGYFNAFSDLRADVITVPVSMSDAGIPSYELAAAARHAGLSATAASDLESGIEEASAFVRNHPEATILFCGSLYMVGEVLDMNGTPPK